MAPLVGSSSLSIPPSRFTARRLLLACPAVPAYSTGPSCDRRQRIGALPGGVVRTQGKLVHPFKVRVHHGARRISAGSALVKCGTEACGQDGAPESAVDEDRVNRIRTCVIRYCRAAGRGLRFRLERQVDRTRSPVMPRGTENGKTENGIVPRSLGKEDSEHDVSLKPFIGALRVLSPSRRA